MNTRVKTVAVTGTLWALAWAAAPIRAVGADSPAAQQKSKGGLYRGAGEVPFRDGCLASGRGDWKTTDDEMQTAQKRDPKEKPEQYVRLNGLWIAPYVPKYYRSLSRCKRTDCPGGRERGEIMSLISGAEPRVRKRLQEVYDACLKACSVAPPH